MSFAMFLSVNYLYFIDRFTHHVLGYRGPTLTFLRGQEGVQFCVAADTEWQESHQYWGGDECAVIQILPLYSIVQRTYFVCPLGSLGNLPTRNVII